MGVSVDPDAIGNLPMPMTYGRHLLRLFDAAQLFAGTGLSREDLEDPDRRITVGGALRYCLNALEAASEPDWYLSWASTLSDHFHGPISVAMMSAPTLGDGVDAFLEFFPSRVPYLHMQGRWRGEHFLAELVPLIDLGRATPMLVETPFIILRQHLEAVYPLQMREAVLELAYPATPHAAGYARHFGCEVIFDATNNALVLPGAWRSLRNLGYLASTWAHAVAQCEATAVSSRERSTLGQVRRQLSASFDQPGAPRRLPSMEEVAASLHLTSRTLARRLQHLGTSYQRLTDDFLKARARELLANDAATIKAVAAELGFDNPANFGKTFKRWFGVSPGVYRAQLGRQP